MLDPHPSQSYVADKPSFIAASYTAPPDDQPRYRKIENILSDMFYAKTNEELFALYYLPFENPFIFGKKFSDTQQARFINRLLNLAITKNDFTLAQIALAKYKAAKSKKITSLATDYFSANAENYIKHILQQTAKQILAGHRKKVCRCKRTDRVIELNNTLIEIAIHKADPRLTQAVTKRYQEWLDFGKWNEEQLTNRETERLFKLLQNPEASSTPTCTPTQAPTSALSPTHFSCSFNFKMRHDSDAKLSPATQSTSTDVSHLRYSSQHLFMPPLNSARQPMQPMDQARFRPRNSSHG